MAKNPDKAKDTQADKKLKAPKAKTNVKTGAKSGAGASKSATGQSAGPDLAARTALDGIAKPAASVTKASKKAKDALKSADKQARKAAKASARNLIPDISMPHVDVVRTAKDIGGQIMSVLNTDAGRVIAAEVLIYLATSLTKAAAKTEAGKDATETVLNAGARIGAAVASVGARAMESGSDAASSGAEAASDAAMSAKDMAREVAQVAVSTVGGVVVEAAQKAMKRRGKSGKNADQPASGVGASPARTGNAAPA